MKFDVTNRWSGEVQFTAEIDFPLDASLSLKIGLAVRWAIKEKADLSEANLTRANLSGADLSEANLSEANLTRANLSGADLSEANLTRANLSGADLSEANLSEANLTRANLSGADLSGADLSGANLSGADLSGANLSEANLTRAEGAELAISMTRIIPEGQIIGWKKLSNGAIAKVSIPADAKRSHAFGRKCRAEFVDVIEGEGVSIHDRKTKYTPGIRVVCDQFDDDWTQECAGGIHFFITRLEAEAYQI